MDYPIIKVCLDTSEDDILLRVGFQKILLALVILCLVAGK